MASTSGEAIEMVTTYTDNEEYLQPDNQIIEKRLKMVKRKMETPPDTAPIMSQVNIVDRNVKNTLEQKVERMEDGNEGTDMVKAFALKSRKRRITDDSDNKFTHPMGTKNPLKETAKIPTKNRFETSQKIIIEKDMHIVPPKQPETNQLESQDKEKSKRPPPPIIIHGVFKDHKYLNNFLSSKLKSKFHWKHPHNTTILQVSTYEEWIVANKKFELGKLEYHTYTPKEDKTHAFVLKGLYHDIDMDQIKEELTIEYDIPVRTIYLMKGTRFQLFMVITTNAITLKHLEQNVKYLDHTVIKWERHINSKTIIQCHRCQMWGHATSNCHASPRCLKCAQQHLTNQCTRNSEDPVKCVNCGEARMCE